MRIQQKPFLDNVITNEQYIQLISGLKQDGDWFWYFIVRFLGCTGARVSELRQFKVEHVTAGYMDIVSKGQKLRRIWIPDSLREESLTWKAKPMNGLLFPGKNDNAITSRGISIGLKRAALRYGVDQDVVYPHSFRHLFAKTLSTATQIFHCLLILWDTKALRQRESICGAPPMSNAPQLIRLLIGNERLKHDEVVDNSVLFG